MNAHAAPSPADFDELDPHHSGDHSHGHVILSGVTLKLVLAVLLLFTAMTVGAAQLEVWITGALGVELPGWVNVAVALSIATVKSALVLLFFMGLKGDNPINSIIFMFCLSGVALFFFFTILDVAGRPYIDPVKAPQIVAGGTGAGVVGADGKPIYLAARERYIAAHGQEAFDKAFAAAHGGHDAHGHGAHAASTASHSRPRSGETPGLFQSAPAGHEAGTHAPAGEAH